MAYEYDIFISYKRKYKRWIEEIYLPNLVSELEEALVRPPKIFFDVSNINTGDDWSERIYRALARSRCMIAFWSPLYFTSKWCLKEFSAILHRQNQLKTTPQGLIFPMNLNDGDSFHPLAQKINYFDFRDYVYNNVTSLKDSPKILEVEDKIRDIVPNLADVIKNAPTFDPVWETKEWLEQPYLDLPPNKPTTITNPSKLWVK